MRSAVLILHTFLQLTSMTSTPRAEPSFECSRAVRPDERAICNDDDLAQRDQLGAQIFAMLARKRDTASAGIEESLRFIDARRACGAEIDCIRREQNALLVALVRIAAPGSRSAQAPIAPVVSPGAESFGRYSRILGAVLVILLCAAFARLIRMVALWRAGRTPANANSAIPEVSEPPEETDSPPDEASLPIADLPKADLPKADLPIADLPIADLPIAETPSATLRRPAGIASWWQRYTSHSGKRALRDIRREERRTTRFRQGRLFNSYGSFLSKCMICDRSQNGARVRVVEPLARLEVVRLLDEVDKIVVEAKVAWQRGNELGLAFRTQARSTDISVQRMGVRAPR